MWSKSDRGRMFLKLSLDRQIRFHAAVVLAGAAVNDKATKSHNETRGSVSPRPRYHLLTNFLPAYVGRGWRAICCVARLHKARNFNEGNEKYTNL